MKKDIKQILVIAGLIILIMASFRAGYIVALSNPKNFTIKK